MARTINNVERRFNREHYPIGIAVNLVAKDDYETWTTLTTGVITCYANKEKVNLLNKNFKKIEVQ